MKVCVRESVCMKNRNYTRDDDDDDDDDEE